MKAVKQADLADVEESTEEVNGELPPQHTDDNDDRSSSEASEDATTQAFDDSEVFLNEGYIREGEETDVEVRKLLEIMRQQQVMLEEIRST
ncbi:hypothetical protein OFM95_27500, partial [Escherichia coli]|nr:hypothetical protein [Escherichia coli]